MLFMQFHKIFLLETNVYMCVKCVLSWCIISVLIYITPTVHVCVNIRNLKWQKGCQYVILYICMKIIIWIFNEIDILIVERLKLSCIHVWFGLRSLSLSLSLSLSFKFALSKTCSTFIFISGSFLLFLMWGPLKFLDTNHIIQWKQHRRNKVHVHDVADYICCMHEHINFLVSNMSLF